MILVVILIVILWILFILDPLHIMGGPNEHDGWPNEDIPCEKCKNKKK